MSRRTTIAVDVDDVLVPHGEVLIDHLNRMFSAQVSMEGFYSLDELMDSFGKTKGEIQQQIHDFLESDEFAAIAPVEEAVAALDQLKRRYDLTVVTARPGITHNMTQRWLQQHFPDTFQDVYFSNFDHEWGTVKNVSKRNVCEAIAAEYLIDDSLKHITEVVECGMRGILFGDYHWNQTDRLPPHTVRADNWDDVLKILLSDDER
ncbi:MAG: hypothetical protein WD467_01470 [Candidatus Saccharimonadales bacterium]